MADILLTDNDMTIDPTTGDLVIIEGPEAIGQHVKMRLLTFLGETVYDQSAGVPWTQVIFARKNPDLNEIRLILEGIILNTPGVLTVQLQDPDLNRTTRVLAISGKLETQEGNVDFSLVFDPTEEN